MKKIRPRYDGATKFVRAGVGRPTRVSDRSILALSKIRLFGKVPWFR